MPCKSHEIFYPECGHVFRCEEPPISAVTTVYGPRDPRRFIQPHMPHSPPPAHPCNKHLSRTLSSADRSLIGSWRMCPHCQGGPKLPDVFILQKFSKGEDYWEWDWERELQEMREYYDRQIHSDGLTEWLMEAKIGRGWDLVEGGLYQWEKDAGRTISCRERTAEQNLGEN